MKPGLASRRKGSANRRTAADPSILGGGGQESGRDDLIGVHVRQRDDDGARTNELERLHHKTPEVGDAAAHALAAAVSRLASRVRAPTPWRPRSFDCWCSTNTGPPRRVAVHTEAHGASRLAPVGAGRAKHLGVSGRFGVAFDGCEPGTISR